MSVHTIIGKLATVFLPSYRMNIIIKEELRAYIDPLTQDEFAALERSLLNEGCRDALVLWGDILVDGHNRYGICQKHDLPFNTVQNTSFQSMDDVHLWMIDNHLGRRSVSDFQRGVLALRKKDILSARLARQPEENSPADTSADIPAGIAEPKRTLSRQEIARTARVSSITLGQIEKIQKSAAPELVDAIKSGEISINAAAVVATLPAEKQIAAAAGGKKELRETARQVRAAKSPPKSRPQLPPLPEDASAEQIEIQRLSILVAELTEERDLLKKKVQNLTIALAESRNGQ
ncbi:hypothetical protein GCM10011430_27300 [Oxalicibacterium solurbis]|uniref:Plasmid replication/partition related protein n=2 Tax=Oxalicibacterium solurbis TaxID=69280 RepID=A0A8J3B0N1_9BURK|nr:hypothetical protein GCM10011430_27300 [Oxalicibacterium solurbis]